MANVFATAVDRSKQGVCDAIISDNDALGAPKRAFICPPADKIENNKNEPNQNCCEKKYARHEHET